MAKKRVDFLDLYLFGLTMAEKTKCVPVFGPHAGKPSARLFLTKASGLVGKRAFEAAYTALSNGNFREIAIDADKFVDDFAPESLGDMDSFVESASKVCFGGRLRGLYVCKAFVNAMREEGLRGDRMPVDEFVEICEAIEVEPVDFLRIVRTFATKTRKEFRVRNCDHRPFGEYATFYRVAVPADKAYVYAHFEELDRMVRNVAGAHYDSKLGYEKDEMVQVLWETLLRYGGRIVEEGYDLEKTVCLLGGYLRRAAKTTLAMAGKSAFSVDDGKVSYDRQAVLSTGDVVESEAVSRLEGIDSEKVRFFAERFGVDFETAMRLVAEKLAEQG